MAEPNSFEEQVQRNLPKVEAWPEFDSERLWLTFYLCGPPGNLRTLSGLLDDRGWTNVQGGEGGFLYPKVQVAKSVTAIVRTAEATRELCDPLDVQINLIDADTSPDVEQSKLEILYRSRS